MGLYIKDPEVDALATELATVKKANKTEAVREALQRELERERGKPSMADLAVQLCRELRARGGRKRGRAADKAFYDSLSGSD